MISLIKNISWYLKEEKVMYIKLFILIILISLLTTIPPKVIGIIIDMIAENKLNNTNLIIFGGLLLLLPTVIYFLNYYYHYNLNLRGQVLSKKLRIIYLSKLFSSDLELYEKYTKGELISRVSNDLVSITQAATVLMSDLIYCTTLIFFIFFIMLFFISWKLTLVAFLIIPLAFFMLNKILMGMRKYYFKHRKIFEKFFGSILESIEGMRLIRGSVFEEDDYKKNEKAIMDDIESWKYIVRFETMFTPFFEFIIAISTFLTFFYGTYLVINQQLTPGNLITFSVYITMISGPLLTLANVYNITNQASIANERFFDIMNTKNQVVEADTPKSIRDFNEISFNNIYYKYPNDKEYTIKDISFKFKKGQKIAFVGPSGSGKSTIVKHLLRDFNPTKGQILIDDEEISKFKIKDILQLVGYVPQIHTLFKGTIKENLEIAKQDISYSDISNALNFSQMQEDISLMEQGLDTQLDEGGRGLSGGQKQRLSITRALLKNPQILILDDSLSAVDANSQKLILDNLKNKLLNKTVIIISHKFSAVKNVDMIYVVNNGEIVEKGNHTQLLENKSWYYSEYLKQVGEDHVK